MVTISVVIPVYNVEQYVMRCLESVMIQDNTIVNVECIIVDDCSPDRSMDVVRQQTADYRGDIRFQLISHDKNQGLSAARNTGVMHATGDYIFFMDSDDYLVPDCFSYFAEFLNKYPEVEMIIGNAENKKGNYLMIPHIQEPRQIDDPTSLFMDMLHHKIYLYAWNKMIRRDVLMKHQVFFEDGILYEDQCWSYKLFSHCSSVLLLPKVTYVYEFNQSSIVNTTFSSGNADKVIWSYTVSANIMLNNPPAPSRYNVNTTVDYMLFVCYFLMSGVDLLSRYNTSEKTAREFLEVRKRLICRSVRYGRLLLTIFFLLLFRPFCHFQKVLIFRRYYNKIEFCVNKVGHLTDFLHNKYRV